jgi:hypothetical protein
MCFVVASQSGPEIQRVKRFVSVLADANSGDGFVVTALTDANYPRLAALGMCTSVLQEFAIKFPTARAAVAWPQLDQHLAWCYALASFQMIHNFQHNIQVSEPS